MYVYNVTLRLVRGSIVDVEKQEVLYTRSVNKVMRLAAYLTIWQHCGLALHMKVR